MEYNSGMIKILMVSMILLVVLGWTVNTIMNAIPPTYADAVTTEEANGEFSTIRSSWENASLGDNVTLTWDNGDLHGGASDNMVWDNIGDTSTGAGTTWTRWFQTITVPTHSRTNSATIVGKFLLGDNTGAENVSVYVILERPGGDNVYILSLENTSALFKADNTTWIAVDNTITDNINASGAYKLFLQDNVDRITTVADNYRGVIWDNFTVTIATQAESDRMGVQTKLPVYGPTIITIIFIGLFIMAVAVLIQYLCT